jgi:hypothetical protein
MSQKGCVFSLFWLILSSSCSQLETVEYPWGKTRTPFMFSVISPEKPVWVYLDQSYMDTDLSDSSFFPEANIYIREADSFWIKLTRYEEDPHYFSSNEIQVMNGKTYQLKVELNQGMNPLTAETTVPTTAAQFINASYSVYDTSSIQTTSGKVVEGVFKAEWNILPEKEYGYILYNCLRTIEYVQTDDVCLSDISDLFYPKDSVDFTLYLGTLDSNLYKWVQNKQIQDNHTFDSGQFFLDIILSSFGGVTPNFSNVENGIGLFGSYLMTSKTFKINYVETY